ncbi:MAG: ClpXP protease specificity-enhancing factor SspB [Pseudomonadota bacterium]
MSESDIRYDVLVENALRGVVAKVLEKVGEDGLTGEQHFYITFRTGDPGVEVPEYLRKRYPSEMTIVLQYQFYGLEQSKEGFAVTLTFNNVPERLVIPYDAITVFADPSVNFALQFQGLENEDDGELDEARLTAALAEAEEADGEGQTSDNSEDDEEAEEKTGEVVSLDSFRKNR